MRAILKRDFFRLFKTKGINFATNFVKHNAYINEINGMVDIIFQNLYTRKGLIGRAFPKTIEKMETKISLRPHTIDAELIWSSRIISKYSNEINDFLKLKAEYNKYVFISEFNRAYDVLEKIEKKYGISLWLIENKMKLR